MPDNAYELWLQTVDSEEITAGITVDGTPELARASVASVTLPGALHASAAVKAAQADRTA